MLLKKVILRNEDKFATAMLNWAQKQNIDVEVFDGKVSLFDLVDSLVIIQEDHNVAKDILELESSIERTHKPTHQIDINATMNASVSSLRFWLENNKPERVLFVGNEKMTDSQRFSDYLEKLAEVI